MPYKILIVDDDHDFCLLVRNTLRRDEYFSESSFTICGDGAEAFEIFKNENPDIILMDVRMPKKNGWQACKEMRAYEKTHQNGRKAIIVIITGIGPNVNEMSSPLHGADDYLDKPGMKDILCKFLQRVINETTT